MAKPSPPCRQMLELAVARPDVIPGGERASVTDDAEPHPAENAGRPDCQGSSSPQPGLPRRRDAPAPAVGRGEDPAAPGRYGRSSRRGWRIQASRRSGGTRQVGGRQCSYSPFPRTPHGPRPCEAIRQGRCRRPAVGCQARVRFARSKECVWRASIWHKHPVENDIFGLPNVCRRSSESLPCPLAPCAYLTCGHRRLASHGTAPI